MALSFFKKKEKSIEELEEETENLEAQNREAEQEMTLAQKRLTIMQLKARGLKVSQFSGDSLSDKFKNSLQWLKTH